MRKFLKKNKIIILCVGFFIILAYSFYSNVFGTTYENLDFKYGRVKTKCLNVRCGPGLNYNKVGKIYDGEYIDVFAKVGDWYIIRTDSDLVGAVSSNYVDPIYDEKERYSVTKSNNNDIKIPETVQGETRFCRTE